MFLQNFPATVYTLKKIKIALQVPAKIVSCNIWPLHTQAIQCSAICCFVPFQGASLLFYAGLYYMLFVSASFHSNVVVFLTGIIKFKFNLQN